MRKGQGISINVIVIAAIALLVLVILSTLVIRSTGDINRGTTCQATGGTCVYASDYNGQCDDEAPENWVVDSTKACTGSTREDPQICCRKL